MNRNAGSIVFNRAVNFVLPNAIPTHLDRSGEYKLGDVLVFEKKLRPLMPWRKYRLVFTGANISELLTEPVEVTNGVEKVFDNASVTRTFGEDAKVDAEIQYAVGHLGVAIAESEHASVSVDFGKIDRHFTNITDVVSQQSGKQIHVSTTHPVIQDALTHNKTLFVINSLYVAERAGVSFNYTAPPDPPANTTSATGGVPTTNTPASTATGSSTSTAAGSSTSTESIGGDVSFSITETGKSGNNIIPLMTKVW